MKRIALFVSILVATVAVAAPKEPLLPKVFAGWQLQSSSSSSDAAKADSVNADLLKEDGVNAIEIAEYTKPDRKLTLKVARFADASGAYSAFLFYRTPQMAVVDVGDQAASNNDRILFRRGNLLVDAKFDRVTPMTAGELRELASELPELVGNSAKPPDIAQNLPKQGMVETSVKYVTGPVGLARIGSRLPAEAIEFGANPEIVAAQYNTGSGAAELTLISYPTPALAGNGLRKVQAWHPPGQPGMTAPAVFSKRTGPYVVVVTGAISDAEAKTLLASVNYDPDVTWNENTHFDRNNNLGSLLVNIIILFAVISGIAIIAGVAFGGVRIVLKKLFPDRVFDRSQDIEIIRLNIGK